MSLKDKLKNSGRVLCSIPIAIGLTISFVIVLPIIPIISIFDLISEFSIKVSLKKEIFTESNALKKELKQFQDKTLPSYSLLCSSNVNNSGNQSSDQIVSKLSYGYQKLNNDAFGEFLKLVKLPEEGSSFSNIVGRIITIPKIFLFLFLKALEAIGLPYSKLEPEKYKKEIIEAFRLLKSKTSMLLNRSAMEKKAASLLRPIILSNIISLQETLECQDFANVCEDMRVTVHNHGSHEEINKKIAESLANIISLLVSVQLRGLNICEVEEHAFFAGEKFNVCVYNIMLSVGHRFSLFFHDMIKKQEPRKLLRHLYADPEVANLQEEFSDFLDNFLENGVLNTLSICEKEHYINMCCIKVLKAYIEEESNRYSDYCSPSPPIGYDDYAKNIASYLSTDIAKSLNLRELANICQSDRFVDYDSPGYKQISKSLLLLLPRESITTGLARSMEIISNIVTNNINTNLKDMIEIKKVQDMPKYSHDKVSSKSLPSVTIKPSSLQSGILHNLNGKNIRT